MKHESFQIEFYWQKHSRQLQIKTDVVETHEPVIALYGVFRDDSYLFSIYPAINSNAAKDWQIVEKDRLSHLPPGFISILGNMIDHFYSGE